VEWQFSCSGLFFIGVSRKEVLIYRACCENPDGTKDIDARLSEFVQLVNFDIDLV
jgi:hypothetical protein